ncbi:MAG: hypothetical protein EA396_14955 [Anaerolineaceae bacterium]|nr:MAG: hypothetical protein EA396_14955 [Anaerolineaceae bacterium]
MENNQTTATETMIRCSNCGHQFPAQVYAYIDVMKEPRAKALLLSGQINTAQCPACGATNAMGTPLLYHDATKELLIALVPMELNMNKDEQERAIGQLMNQLPKDNFKGYMFSPRRAMTMQGLIEQVLEADGVTREMIEEQKQRVTLAQELAEAETQEALVSLIQANDDKIDERFMMTLSSLVQRMSETGQAQLAQHIVRVQDVIVENSSYGETLREQQQQQGAVLQEVADSIQAMGEGAQRADFLDLALSYAEEDMHLQALVSLARPAFDHEFFQMLTNRIESAPAEERLPMEKVREAVLQVTTAIDQQQEVAMQQAARFLQAVVNHQNPRELLIANAPLVDDMFMQVLDVNIQQAEQQKNIQLLTRLKEIQQTVYQVLQSSLDPELRFLNELLQADEADTPQMIAERIDEFGPNILEVMDAVENLLEQQQSNPALVSRLHQIREQIQAQLQA